MARLSWVQRLYWRYLSKPACERALFLHVLEKPIGSIERVDCYLSVRKLQE